MGSSKHISALEPRYLCAGDTVAYWRFENGGADQIASDQGSIADDSGSSFNATPVGGPVYRGDIAPGVLPNGALDTLSLDFNGIDQGVVVDDDPAFALTGSLTLEALINVRSTRPTAQLSQKVIMRGDDRAGLDPY